MTGKGAKLTTGGKLPELDGVVLAATGEQGAIGAESDTVNIACMIRKGAELTTGGKFPELDGPVTAATGEQGAIGAESDTVNIACMTRKGAKLRPEGSCQSLMVLSLLPLATREPSELKVTLITPFV